jgi:hypothetical protein
MRKGQLTMASKNTDLLAKSLGDDSGECASDNKTNHGSSCESELPVCGHHILPLIEVSVVLSPLRNG